jgi:Holliday junction resolvasome RuvABC DNA-binding subunit
MRPTHRKCSTCKTKLPIDRFQGPYFKECIQCIQSQREEAELLLKQSFDALLNMGYSTTQIIYKIMNPESSL